MQDFIKAKIIKVASYLPLPLKHVSKEEARKNFFELNPGYIRIEKQDENGYREIVYATLDEEEFYKSKEEIEFAMRLNNIRYRKTIKNCIVIMTILFAIGLVVLIVSLA